MSLHDDLKAYLDGELDSVRADEVKTALDRDPSLRREFVELTALSREIREQAPVITPYGLEQTLSALGRQSRSQQLRVAYWLWTGGFAVASVLLIAIIFPVFSQAKSAAKRMGGSMVASEFFARRQSDASAPVADTAASAPAESARDVGSAPAMSAAKSAEAAKTPSAPAIAPPTRVALASPSLKRHEMFGRRNPVPGVPPPADARRAREDEPARQILAKNISGPEKERGGTGLSHGGGALAAGADRNSVIIAPTRVTLSFESRRAGIERINAIAGQYRAPTIVSTPEGGTGGEAAAAGSNIIALDIPEDVADQVIGELKKLPAKQSSSTEVQKGVGFRNFTAQDPNTKLGGGIVRGGAPLRQMDTARFGGRARNVGGGAGGKGIERQLTPPGQGNVDHNGIDAATLEAKPTPSALAKGLHLPSVHDMSGRTPRIGQRLGPGVRLRRVIIVIEEDPKPVP